MIQMQQFKYTPPELQARKVLDECGLTDPTEYPLSQIILGRRAFYEEKPLSGKEGEIVSVSGRSIITVNSNIAFETKKRFAAAHELGHYELHKDLKPVFNDTEESLINWYQGGEHEQEANQFAAEFLMPSDVFHRECIQQKAFEPKVIDYLATRFQVSKTAVILKFVNRGSHPVFIMFCKNNQMKWWKKSVDFHHFCHVFKYNAPPPTGSVAYEVFNSNKVYQNDEAKQQIWKSDWFQMRENETKDPAFYEYCLFSRSYNYVISVIWEK
jgi:Zn-dependent peptidase ImmA (M78 family)